MKSEYEKLGVDRAKNGVKKAFARVIDNEYPHAFVNITSVTGKPGRKKTMHNDGDGSKSVQRVLDFLENGNTQVFKGMVDDGFVMNAGDVSASGFVFGPWDVTDIININKAHVNKEAVMSAIAERMSEIKVLYHEHGFDVSFLGGETADLPDQVKTLVFDVCLRAEESEKHIIAGNVTYGDAIYGFASNGQAVWEEGHNSGLMSNGLTLARTCLMHLNYTDKYPFFVRDGGAFKGRFGVNYADFGDSLGGLTISEAIMSPTRHFPIVIRKLMEKLKQKEALHMLHGMSLNTGGGATKIRNVGRGIKYIKKMPKPPKIFQLIQAESGEPWKEMFMSFNCGIGLDVVGLDHEILESAIVETSLETGVKYFRLGSCEERSGPEGNGVVLHTDYGTFKY